MQTINLREYPESVFSLFDPTWALLSAKDEDRYNMMTVSWGGLGVLWNRDVATVYVRPQRYTLEFMDLAERFTLSFFPESVRPALRVCGAKSGRDIDKMHMDGLTPVFPAEDIVTFEEAKLTLVCRKLYRGRLAKESFLDTSLPSTFYPGEDFHYLFVGEITQALTPDTPHES